MPAVTAHLMVVLFGADPLTNVVPGLTSSCKNKHHSMQRWQPAALGAVRYRDIVGTLLRQHYMAAHEQGGCMQCCCYCCSTASAP